MERHIEAMTMHTPENVGSRKNEGDSAARIAADTALAVTVGGTVLAAEKAAEKSREAVDQVVEGAERAARQFRSTLRDSAEAAADAAGAVAAATTDGRGLPNEERTRDELYALARAREIMGRSSRTQLEVIAAQRAEL
jgi:hypothetical protein